ncbi:UNVERIFIED_CONTAM: hypothetical protein FKN15_012910 [Acipenser sinensis]
MLDDFRRIVREVIRDEIAMLRSEIQSAIAPIKAALSECSEKVREIPHFVSTTETQQKPVQKLNFADFSKFSEEEENAAKNEAQGQLGKAAGSFEESSPLKKDILPAQPPLKPIRRKYRPESQNLDSQDPTPPLPPPSSSSAPGTKPHPPLQK